MRTTRASTSEETGGWPGYLRCLEASDFWATSLRYQQKKLLVDCAGHVSQKSLPSAFLILPSCYCVADGLSFLRHAIHNTNYGARASATGIPPDHAADTGTGLGTDRSGEGIGRPRLRAGLCGSVYRRATKRGSRASVQLPRPRGKEASARYEKSMADAKVRHKADTSVSNPLAIDGGEGPGGTVTGLRDR
jgi:hypothetical protein